MTLHVNFASPLTLLAVSLLDWRGGACRVDAKGSDAVDGTDSGRLDSRKSELELHAERIHSEQMSRAPSPIPYSGTLLTP